MRTPRRDSASGRPPAHPDRLPYPPDELARRFALVSHAASGEPLWHFTLRLPPGWAAAPGHGETPRGPAPTLLGRFVAPDGGAAVEVYGTALTHEIDPADRLDSTIEALVGRGVTLVGRRAVRTTSGTAGDALVHGGGGDDDAGRPVADRIFVTKFGPRLFAVRC